MPNLDIEQTYRYETIAGIDEVGRGALAGPVVVGAVIISAALHPLDHAINDSKKLTKIKRNTLNTHILANHVCGIGSASVYEINQYGIVKAVNFAITRAISSLNAKPTLLLIDGNDKFNLDTKYLSIINGDAKSTSIAAASIIAKVYRDKLMQGLAMQYTPYGWHTNVGYGTKEHLEAVKQHGRCQEHRNWAFG